MKKIKEIISEGEYRDSMTLKRLFTAECSPEQYKKLFLEAAKKRTYGSVFVVDRNNKETINQFYYYLAGSDQFNGDLRKGIILAGAIGNGKTLIMESFIQVFNKTAGKIITEIHAKDIARITAENHIGYLNRRPLFIDDIGKEQPTANNYGNITRPMEDMINERYKNLGLTLATTNYKFEDLGYSNHSIDRMRQMFNVIILPGKSRR